MRRKGSLILTLMRWLQMGFQKKYNNSSILRRLNIRFQRLDLEVKLDPGKCLCNIINPFITLITRILDEMGQNMPLEPPTPTPIDPTPILQPPP